MQVSFRNTQATVPQTNQGQLQEKPSKGFFDTTREAWKTTLKTKETACAYTSGFFRGLKNAAYAGTALVGIDWLVRSGYNIANNNKATSVGHMLATPFILGWKSIRNVSKFVFDLLKKDGPSLTKALKIAVWDAPKKVLGKIYGKNASKNISSVSKIGLPIIALAVAGYTTFRSCLDANERNARIDHRYRGEVGHHKA